MCKAQLFEISSRYCKMQALMIGGKVHIANIQSVHLSV